MKLKKILSSLLILCMISCTVLIGTSCDNEKSDGKYKIGICQYMPHAALDAATKGFKDAIIAELGEENVEFVEQNANGEQSVCTTIVNDLINKKVDLILGNATAALQAAVNGTESIPVLGTSITDYMTALQLDEFNGTIGSNISGTTDLAPLDKQADMILELFPETKKVGLLYCSSEPNSEYQVTQVKKYLEEKGIECKKFGYADSTDMSSVSSATASWSDAIYVPTDNLAANSPEAIDGAIGNVPLIAGEADTCSGCGVATLSIDYYELGKITGQMAVKILKGESNISDMPIESVKNFTKLYNAEKCKQLGIDTKTLEDLGYTPIG